MTKIITGHSPVVLEIAKVLGLPETVRGFRINVEAGQPVTVEFEFYCEKQQGSAVLRVLERRKLGLTELDDNSVS